DDERNHGTVGSVGSVSRQPWLTWETLGRSMIPSEIDEAILSVTEPQWHKVAVITTRTCARLGLDSSRDAKSLDLVLERICALVAEGGLLEQGDTSKPRCSEVGLP